MTDDEFLEYNQTGVGITVDEIELLARNFFFRKISLHIFRLVNLIVFCFVEYVGKK